MNCALSLSNLSIANSHFELGLLKWVFGPILFQLPSYPSRGIHCPYQLTRNVNHLMVVGDDLDLWVCPVSTDCLPLSHSASSQSNPFVLSEGLRCPRAECRLLVL